MDLPKIVHYVNVVWGESYVKSFLRYNLPSQLSAKNLPLAVKKIPSHYWIYTQKKDAEIIRNSQAFSILQSIMPASIVILDEFMDPAYCKENKYLAMSECHNHLIQRVSHEDFGLVVIGPDAIYADGNFSYLMDLVIKGERVILTTAFRTNKETILPAAEQYISKSDGILTIQSREIISLSCKHIHTLSKQIIWGNTPSDSWPSVLMWKLKDDGYLMRCFHIHPSFVRPVLRGNLKVEGAIDNDFVMLACPNVEPHFILDSDNFTNCEFTSDSLAYENADPNPVTITKVVDWARVSANYHHRQWLEKKFFLHTNDIGPEHEEIIQESDNVVKSILSEFPERLIDPNEQKECSVALLVLSDDVDSSIITSLQNISDQNAMPDQIVFYGSNSACQHFFAKIPGNLQSISSVAIEESSSLSFKEKITSALRFINTDLVHIANYSASLEGRFLEKHRIMLSLYPQSSFSFSEPATKLESTNKLTKINGQFISNCQVFFRKEDFIKLFYDNKVHETTFTHEALIFRKASLEKFLAEQNFPSSSDMLLRYAATTLALQEGYCYIPDPLVVINQKNQILRRPDTVIINYSNTTEETIRHCIHIANSELYQNIRYQLTRFFLSFFEPIEVLIYVTNNQQHISILPLEILKNINVIELLLLQAKNITPSTVVQMLEAAITKPAESPENIAARIITEADFEFTKGDITKAKLLYQKLRAMFPNLAHGHIGFASLSQNELSNDEIFHILEQGIGCSGITTELLNKAGVLYANIGSLQKAKELFHIAHQAEPNNEDFKFNYSEILQIIEQSKSVLAY